MNKRLKQIRLEAKLSQKAFGARIGIQSNSRISILETDGQKIPDRVIADVCRVFDVNEEWLRTGVGPIYKKSPEKERLLASVGYLINKSDDFTLSLISSILDFAIENPEFFLHLKERIRQYMDE